jgi:hypothetical protein
VRARARTLVRTCARRVHTHPDTRVTQACRGY